MRRELLAALREQAAREERTNFSHNVHTHFGNLRIQNWSENGPNGQNNSNQHQNVVNKIFHFFFLFLENIRILMLR